MVKNEGARRAWVVAVFPMLLLGGCGGRTSLGGPGPSGLVDAGFFDVGATDAAPFDAVHQDRRPGDRDAGFLDAGAVDRRIPADQPARDLTPRDDTPGLPDAGADLGGPGDGGRSDLGPPDLTLPADLAVDLGRICSAVQSTVFVDGLAGDDSGNGAVDCPVKSISRGLAIAKGASFTAVPGLVRVAGGTSAASPIVYSTATTGETFPLVVKHGLVLAGAGADPALAVIVGGGDCGGGSGGESCAVLMPTGGTLGQLTITNPGGNGVVVTDASYVELSSLALDASGLAGLRLTGLSGDLFLYEVTATHNGTDGIVIDGSGGVAVCTVTSSFNGRAGLLLGGAIKATVRNDLFASNGGDGISAGEQSVLIMGNTTVASNGGSGVALNDDVHVLIDGGGEDAPNTLQSSQPGLANAGAGLCNRSSSGVNPFSNHWSACPPTQNPDGACAGGVDIGTDGIGPPVNGQIGCLTP